MINRVQRFGCLTRKYTGVGMRGSMEGHGLKEKKRRQRGMQKKNLSTVPSTGSGEALRLSKGGQAASRQGTLWYGLTQLNGASRQPWWGLATSKEDNYISSWLVAGKAFERYRRAVAGVQKVASLVRLNRYEEEGALASTAPELHN
ncbi:hypothetical protein EMWEY_00047190 [Eimeria maxima]|uniref:Uncharacterized protein n=1 Tax=Eimeria maxima TaxID=5804 RepID=U6M4S9_EIMMA|nr:hypothetical protein EMWEY_00047190 [Eimeria maxima]CDJ58058.1 hypothetical protein EMWEY_00047190 [Eimeria maxima]